MMTIHCPNTGSMKNCWQSGAKIWFSTSTNKKRKYPCTWEIVTTPAGHKAGINTTRANTLVKEAIETGVVRELANYSHLQSEVRYGEENSRIDLLLSSELSKEQCYVEIKSVTLYVGEQLGMKHVGLFPDAVSSRGTKHLRELIKVVERGDRAVLFYCVQHSGIKVVKPATAIDSQYSETLRAAIASGVEVLVYGAKITPGEIVIRDRLPFLLD